MLPKVSIVTPSYNQAEYLEQTIQSVMSQRDQIHEYFVLDGGSSDGSQKIIEKYDGEIDFWISEPDGGQAAAIRNGFARATGDILAWINSDDLILPGAISAVREYFSRHETCQALTGYFCQIGAASELVRCMWVPPVSERWIRWGVKRICQPSTFFSRKLYEQIGGLDSRWKCVLDTELWCRMLQHQCDWHVLPRYLAARRYHSATKGETLGEDYHTERSELARIYPRYRPGHRRRRIGQLAFRAVQGMSPGFWKSVTDTRLYHQQPVSSLPVREGR